jgi:hypothetical protein
MSKFLDRIISWESGLLSEDEMIDLFQDLINSGVAWSLQGTYGRTAEYLIDTGYCTRPGDEPTFH